MGLGPVPSNPFFAEVLFTVGDFDLTPIPPQYLRQFTYERITDSTTGSANKFTLEVFDSPGLELEYKISQGLENCKFQYGYHNGKKSRVFSGQITYYDTDFTSGGVVITIEGVSSGLTALGKPSTKSYKDGLISDYVTQIAGEEGWKIGYIEPTKPVSDGEVKNKTYRKNNTDAVTFITNTLVPEAKSAKSGESGYLLYFDDKDDGSYVYFCTPNWKNENSKTTGDSSAEEDSLLQYEFDALYMKDSEVISFNPEYSGLLTAVLGSNEVDASTVDALKNEMFSVNVKNGNSTTRAVLGSKRMKSSYNTALCNSSASADELENIAATMWYAQAAQSYPATLEVLGNPGIEPQKYCSVLVMLQGGFPHHSSGIYLITSVTDDIQGGTFTSRMQLVRNGLNVGVDENGGISVTAAAPPQIGSGSDIGGTNPDGTPMNPPIGSGNSDIVSVALSQEGYKEGSNNDTIYGSWYGMNHNAWCAMFVSWCANQAGIPTSVIPKYASVSTGMQWFKDHGNFYYKGSYTPVQGDIIFFKSAGASHTGIVISSDGSKVYTIEGNTSDMVAKRSYSLNEAKITGYGHPAYTSSGGRVTVDTSGATDGSGLKTT